jgi:cell division protein YceG involved in septum cleavage
MRQFFRSLLFVIVWTLLLGGGYAAFDAYTFLTTPGSKEPEEIVFTINPGATFDRVAWDLKKAGALSDVPRFRILAYLNNSLGKVKAGDYLVNTGWTPNQILRQITQGQSMLFRLSIREGLTWWQTARAVEDQGFARFEDFSAVIHDPEFLRKHNIPFANAEGFLYPETYLLPKPRAPLDKKQAEAVADIMVNAFWKHTEPVWRQLPKRQTPPGANSLQFAPTPGAMSSEPVPIRDETNKPAPSGSATQPTETTNSADKGVSASAAAAQTSGKTGGRKLSEILGKGNTAPNAQAALPTGGNSTSPLPPVVDARAQAASPASDMGASALPRASANATPSLPAQGQAPVMGDAASPSPTNATRPSPAIPSPTGAAAGAAPSVNGTIPGAEAIGPAAPTGPQSPAEVEPSALRRLIILASLVEMETGVPEERARVAGVYVNRLRLGMLLQCDPTIIYGIGPAFSGAIRRSQLEDAGNKYNTYKHPGLPPGPICSPGLAAIRAAFEPERHEYLYFVATGVDAGHSFSKTSSEHNKAVQLYRARMSGKNTKPE